MEILELIIANCILLWLFTLSSTVVNLLHHYKNTTVMNIPEGRKRVEYLDIEVDLDPQSSAEPQRVKLYNMVSLP